MSGGTSSGTTLTEAEERGGQVGSVQVMQAGWTETNAAGTDGENENRNSALFRPDVWSMRSRADPR